VPEERKQAGGNDERSAFGAVLVGMMVPAAEAQLLVADNDLIRLTPSLGSGGGG
jgi:hypothetical protein